MSLIAVKAHHHSLPGLGSNCLRDVKDWQEKRQQNAAEEDADCDDDDGLNHGFKVIDKRA